MMKMNYERFKRLIGKLKRGKQEYFDEFYELTKGAVYYKIKSYGSVDSAAAEDIMQETYVSFLKHIDSADENGNPLAYLLTIAGNKTIDELRKNGRFDKEIDPEELNIKTTEVYSHDMPLVETCRKKLSPEDFGLLELTVIYGYKRTEVAKMLDKPISTVNRRYNDLLKKIKIFYGEAYK